MLRIEPLQTSERARRTHAKARCEERLALRKQANERTAQNYWQRALAPYPLFFSGVPALCGSSALLLRRLLTAFAHAKYGGQRPSRL